MAIGCRPGFFYSLPGLRLYEVKANDTFKPEFAANMKAVGGRLGNVVSASVVYNGPSMPPVTLNLREI